MQDFKQLLVWKKAISLATDVYKRTSYMPNEERFGLTSQLRRSAVSVSSNIAEGAGRSSPGDFKRFLDMARGSLNELETQLIIVQELKLLDDCKLVIDEIDILRRMLYQFSEKLKTAN